MIELTMEKIAILTSMGEAVSHFLTILGHQKSLNFEYGMGETDSGNKMIGFRSLESSDERIARLSFEENTPEGEICLGMFLSDFDGTKENGKLKECLFFASFEYMTADPSTVAEDVYAFIVEGKIPSYDDEKEHPTIH